MPERIRTTIHEEVARQMKLEPLEARRSGIRRTRRIALTAAAAVAVMGVTALAGSGLYRLYSEKVGNYGLRTVVQSGETEEKPQGIPEVQIRAGYLPEGMEETAGETGKYSFVGEAYGKGGISCSCVLLDSSVEEQAALDKNVTYSEEVTLGEHEGVYLEEANLFSDPLNYTRRIYVTYPEVSRMLEIYVQERISKEEALKVAEGIELIPTGEMLDAEVTDYMSVWGEEAEVETERSSEYDGQMVSADGSGTMLPDGISVSQAAFEESLHTLGEAVPFTTLAETADGESCDAELSIRVTGVRAAEDLGGLDPQYIDEDLAAAADEAGNLLPLTMRYVKSGDGVQTADAIVREETEPCRLVIADVAFSNPTDQELVRVLYYLRAQALVTLDGRVAPEEAVLAGAGTEWDSRNCSCPYVLSGERAYYDAQNTDGTTNGGNYIPSLGAGETVTVHIGFLATESMLDHLYLSLKGVSGVSEEALEAGYVDISQ